MDLARAGAVHPAPQSPASTCRWEATLTLCQSEMETGVAHFERLIFVRVPFPVARHLGARAAFRQLPGSGLKDSEGTAMGPGFSGFMAQCVLESRG